MDPVPAYLSDLHSSVMHQATVGSFHDIHLFSQVNLIWWTDLWNLYHTDSEEIGELYHTI